MKGSWPALICMALALLLMILTVVCNGCVTIHKNVEINVLNPVIQTKILIDTNPLTRGTL